MYLYKVVSFTYLYFFNQTLLLKFFIRQQTVNNLYFTSFVYLPRVGFTLHAVDQKREK